MARFEVENLTNAGKIGTATTRPGYSGRSYVTGWKRADGALTANILAFFPVAYRMRVRVISTSGATLTVRIDGEVEHVIAVPASNPSSWSAANDYEFQIQLSGGFHSLAFEPGEVGEIDVDHIDLLSTDTTT